MMPLISILHPSRQRAKKSYETIAQWCRHAIDGKNIEVVVSVDDDDPEIEQYRKQYGRDLIINKNRSAVNAINAAAKYCRGDILIVVSDDTQSYPSWKSEILSIVNGKTDWILKTQDGIQNYIITNPIMDRAYYNRIGYIYHPDFSHLFCDTWLTIQADVTGRKITSNLMFKHNHYSVNGEPPDELHKRNDATWKQGQDTFIRLVKQLTPQEKARITDQGMKNWLRNHGV